MIKLKEKTQQSTARADLELASYNQLDEKGNTVMILDVIKWHQSHLTCLHKRLFLHRRNIFIFSLSNYFISLLKQSKNLNNILSLSIKQTNK